jgi:hypothetical protein
MSDRFAQQLRFGAAAAVSLLAAAALGLLITDAGTHVDGVETQFADTRGYGVWQAMVVVQLVLWASVAAIGGYRLRRTGISGRQFGLLSLVYLGVALLAGAILGVAPLALNLRVGAPEPGHEWRIGALDLLGVLAAWTPAIGLFHVWLQATEGETDSILLANPRAILRRLDEMSGEVRLNLALLGAMIAAVVFTTSALAQAVANAPGTSCPGGGKPLAGSPISEVLYGLGWAAFVGAIWVPAFLSVRRLAVAALDKLHPLPQTTSNQEWPAILETRAKVSEALHANSSFLDAFRSGLLILAPLAASLLGLLMPK